MLKNLTDTDIRLSGIGLTQDMVKNLYRCIKLCRTNDELIPLSCVFVSKPKKITKADREWARRLGIPEFLKTVNTTPASENNLNPAEPVSVELLAHDAHTRHCCVNCGCKYGEDDTDCTVRLRTKKQERICSGSCYEHY